MNKEAQGDKEDFGKGKGRKRGKKEGGREGGMKKRRARIIKKIDVCMSA